MKLIIDGNNYANIAFYQAKNILRKKKDQDNYVEMLENMTVKVFFNIFHKYMREHKGGKFYIVWDGRHGSKWRKEKNPKYKSNREHKSDSYKVIFNGMDKIVNILNNYPVYQFKFDECEADDIIYTLCEYNDEEAIVFSSDGDMLQLPQKFNYVKVFNPRKKKYEEILEYDVVTMKALMGDSSDNITGLSGVGPKTALKYINGVKQLTEEQKKIVEENKIIIDMALNPSIKENNKKVNNLLKTFKISYNKDQVKRLYFDYKLGEFVKKWDYIDNLIYELTKEYNNGGNKAS